MSTAVEKRMLSLEDIEAQTALVLPERELMHHHKHHHHHHHATHITIVNITQICVNHNDQGNITLSGNAENEVHQSCGFNRFFSPFGHPFLNDGFVVGDGIL